MRMKSCVGMPLTVGVLAVLLSQEQYSVRVTPVCDPPCQADRASNEPGDVLVLVPWAHDKTAASHSAGDGLDAPENV